MTIATKYPYADKLAKIKAVMLDLGINPAYYKEYSGIIDRKYVDEKLPTLLTALLHMVDKGVYPSLNLTTVQDIALLAFIKERDISSYTTSILAKFEKEHGIIVAAANNVVFLDTDKRFVDFKSIGEALQKIVESGKE